MKKVDAYGDLGVMDKEGNIFIKGRAKACCLAHQEKHLPEEIEAVINNMDYIAESLVIWRIISLSG